MPLYEYQCPKDGVFELMQRFSDPPLETCPTCGAPVEKLLSAPAIQFKGSGWYITDYARKSSGEAAGKDKAGSESKAGEAASSSKETASSSGSGSAAASSTPASSGDSNSKK